MVKSARAVVTGLLALLVAAGAASPVAAQATPAPTAQGTPQPFAGLAQDLYQRARAALDANDLERAVLDFGLFLTFNPQSSQAHFGMGLALLGLDQPERALASLNHALDTASDSAAYRAALLSTRARVQMALEDPTAALADLSAAIDQNPGAETRADRARLYAQLGEYPAALVDLNAALALSPEDPALFLLRAFVYSEMGNTASAAVDYLGYISLIGQDVSEGEALTPGQAVLVTLEEGLVHALPFRATAGQAATIIVEGRPGAQIDALILLLSPDGQPLAGDDDSGGNLNPLLRAVRLPATGTYHILLTHAFGGAVGDVAIALQLGKGAAEGPAEPAAQPTPTPGQ